MICGTSITHSTAQKTMQSSTRIFQKKKKVKTRKWTTNLRQTARKKTGNKIDPDHTTTQNGSFMNHQIIKVHIKPTTTSLHFTSNLARLVSEYTFICHCFNLLRKFFYQKYSAISRDPFYGFRVWICVKIARLIAE